jgi:hypothetical protein
MSLRLLPVWATFLWLIHATTISADEFALLETSTVLGRNFGIPTGTPLQDRSPIGHVDLVTETAIYVKNLELVGVDDPVEGQTFIAFKLPLRFRYEAHEQLRFELGAMLGHDFGDDDELNVADAIVRVIWEPSDNLFAVAGTIFPTHWIHDGILDDVQKMRESTEQGFQLRIDRDRWKQDAWINWRIREGKVRSEEFEIATSMRALFDRQRLWLDASFMWDHAGGQISSEDRLDHNTTLLAGASYGFPHPFGIQALDQLRVGARAIWSFDDTRHTDVESGSGWEIHTSLDTYPREGLLLRFHASWFEGDDFVGRRGDPIYAQDQYQQIGVGALFSPIANLYTEAGLVIQRIESETNYSFQVHVSWGEAFEIGFLKPRRSGP